MATVLSALRGHRRRSSSLSRDNVLDVLLHRREPSGGSHDDSESKRSFSRSRNASKVSLPPSSFKSRNSGFFDIFKRDKDKDRDKDHHGLSSLVVASGAAAAVGSDEAGELVAKKSSPLNTPIGSFTQIGHFISIAGDEGVPDAGKTQRDGDPQREKEEAISVTPFVAGDSRRFSLPGDEVPLRSIPLCAGLESDPAETAKPVTRERQMVSGDDLDAYTDSSAES